MKREQRAAPLGTAVSRPNARTSGDVPGNLDIVQQPGADMEDNTNARQAGEAVSSQWGGRPNSGSPQVGRKGGE